MEPKESRLFWLHCRSCTHAVSDQCIRGVIYCNLHHTYLNNLSCCNDHKTKEPEVVAEINTILDSDTPNVEKITELSNKLVELENLNTIQGVFIKHIAKDYINGKVELKYLTRE